MRRAGAAFVGLLVIAGASSGCPGKLDNPDQFASTVPCDPQGLLHFYCSGGGCHDTSAAPDASPDQLDLLAPGVEARLVDQPATYYGVPDNQRPRCPDPPQLLIDTANPSQSLFLLKIDQTSILPCGSHMPYSGRLPRRSEIQCLKDWALGLAGATPDSGAGGSTP
jgi:hypothetical protein